MKKFFSIVAVCAFAASASAQTFQQAQNTAQQNLLAAEKEYNELQVQITNEYQPLSKQLNDIESQVLRMRQEYTEQRRLVEGSETSLINLQSQVNGLNDNINYLTNLLADYISRFESLINLGERPLYQAEVRQAGEARENSDLSAGQRFEEQLDVISMALNRLEKVIGGQTFEGTALTGSGEQVEGSYVLIGPATYFAPSGEVPAGITISQVNSIQPQIGANLPSPDANANIRALASTGSATVLYGPLQAYIVEIEKDNLLQEFQKGGMVMYPIIGLTLLAFLLALYKWIELAGVKSARQRDLDIILEHLGNGRQDEAMAYAKSVGGPVGEMLQGAVENAYEDREVLEEVLYEKIISTQPKLERMLPFIAVVAATAPLLGLLGTVTGMIKTFKLITIVGTGDAASLSSGISEALITTKWGLISAIPCLILHALLSRKARGVVGSMEQTAVGFINGVTQISDTNTQSA